MGLCGSKPEQQDQKQQQQQQQKEQQREEPSADDIVAPAAASPTPCDGDELVQPHHYNSAEKPFKSAMRPSMEVRTANDGAAATAAAAATTPAASDGGNATSTGGGAGGVTPGGGKPNYYSRRSSSGVSTVGFAVKVDAPDAESASRGSFAGADSIALKKVVDVFYDKVTADDALGVFFRGIDLAKLKRHQLRFMGLAFGGKELVFEEDPNLNLRKVHYHLIRDRGLTLAHWERFVGLFDETMQQLEREIPSAARAAAHRSIRATKHYFVPIGQETEFTHQPLAALPSEDVAGALAPAAQGR